MKLKLNPNYVYGPLEHMELMVSRGQTAGTFNSGPWSGHARLNVSATQFISVYDL